jgi:hypothetical protein
VEIWSHHTKYQTFLPKQNFHSGACSYAGCADSLFVHNVLLRVQISLLLGHHIYARCCSGKFLPNLHYIKTLMPSYKKRIGLLKKIHIYLLPWHFELTKAMQQKKSLIRYKSYNKEQQLHINTGCVSKSGDFETLFFLVWQHWGRCCYCHFAANFKAF